MSAARVELGREGDPQADPASVFHAWPRDAGRTSTFRSDLDWDATQFGACSPQARDLLRAVSAAYIADRTAAQPSQRLARALTVTVHVEDPAAWTQTAKEELADLLHWLTGDDWALRCVAHTATAGGALPVAFDVPAADDVCLLSGGLDSLCGALIRLGDPAPVFFLGHADTATAVRRAQQRIQQHLKGGLRPVPYVQYALRPVATPRNRSPKTRSLLFMAMAVAAATGMGARRVLVPENGFTSINPPLEPSRAGVLTTRSTHPWTFHALGRLLGHLGLGNIQVLNPHGDLTKGELLALAMPAASTAEQSLAAATLSCAKLNAGRPKGGDPNVQCGLCVACLVRRAAFIGASVPDLTAYTVNTLTGPGLAKARQIRRHDTDAWRAATTAGIPEHRILGSAVWPPGTDLDNVLALCGRGLRELARVPV